MAFVRIVVMGGTGTAGSVLVRQAVSQGMDVVVLSRRPGNNAGGAALAVGELSTGAGLREAFTGADAVIDCSNVRKLSRRPVEQFFVTGTRNLVEAAASADVGRLVLLSIVGIDRVPMGYYQAKLAQEAALIELAGRAGLPYTIARVTQFHEFAGQILNRSRLGRWALVPRMRVQPVDLTDVAEHLLATAGSQPTISGRAPDLAGPAEQDLADMAARLVAKRGDRVRVVPIRLPGRAGRAVQAGGLLPAPGSVTGRRTFEEWLAER
ncbi:MAG TPA: NAD(P)H-binding protein [Jatrophihabitans sp.]|nr:NAD(P)H-binding protein [Jatrophihabitans sp.]